MLSEKQIESISKSLTEGNKGHAEKLYLQDIILLTISRETVKELVFKGGTALLKFYQLDRFSEDLDFTLNGDIEFEKLVDKIERDLSSFGAEVEERKMSKSERSFKCRLGIKGPLYQGERRTLSFIRIEVNRKSSVEDVETHRYAPRFQDISAFDMPILSEEEIIAEKIRAIRTREKPRDLYDIYHLLGKGVEIQEGLVNSKLGYYELKHDSEATLRKAEQLEEGWGMMSSLTYGEPPEFEDALKALKEGLRED